MSYQDQKAGVDNTCLLQTQVDKSRMPRGPGYPHSKYTCYTQNCCIELMYLKEVYTLASYISTTNRKSGMVNIDRASAVFLNRSDWSLGSDILAAGSLCCKLIVRRSGSRADLSGIKILAALNIVLDYKLFRMLSSNFNSSGLAFLRQVIHPSEKIGPLQEW